MKSCSCLILVALLVLAVPARAEVIWEVVESADDAVRVRVVVSGEQVQTGQDGFLRVQLTGAHTVGEPGLPALPAAARWIALPANGAASVRVLDVTVEPLANGRVAPVPVPELLPETVEGPRLHERLEIGPGYTDFRVGSNDVVSLGAPVFQRRHRTVAVAVRPVLYDAGSGQLTVVRSVEFEVRWPAPGGGGDLPAVADQTILRTVLNPVRAREWASFSPRQRQIREAALEAPVAQRAEPVVGIGPFDPSSLVADGIRLRVNHSGIVRVALSDLVSAAGLPDDVPRSWLRLAQMRGSEPGSAEYPRPLVVDVPLHLFGAPDESQNIQLTDELYFAALRVEDDADTLESGGVQALPPLPWGESSPLDQVPPRYAGDHFNRDNVYWLFVAPPPAGGWARMEALDLPASSGSPAPHYLRREHFESDQGYRDDPFDPWVERFAWNRKEDTDVVRAIRVVNPRPGTDLLAEWAAGTAIDGTPEPIHFTLRQGANEWPLQSQRLGTNGIMAPWSRALSAPALADGAIEFRMYRLLNGSQFVVNSYLDHVDLQYEALFRASDDALRFRTGTNAAVADVEVDGYTRNDLVCFDVTDPRRPRWIRLAAANVEDRSAGGPVNFALSLSVPQPDGSERTLTASPRVRYPRIQRTAMESDPTAALFDVATDLQVLAIGPEIFRDAAERWVAWREQIHADSGWNFGYVDVQQIYDEFSGGLQSPWAIQQFVEWAWLNWNSVALVIFGDANEDTFNASGVAGPNFVPPSLHLQSFSGTRELLASDKWFGLFGYEPSGNASYPKGLAVTSDLLIGRLPVGSVDQVNTLVDKLMAYEQPGADESWRRRTLWVADDAYSSLYLGAGEACYEHQAIEEGFRISQQTSADVADAALDGLLASEVQDANTYTSQCRPGSTGCLDVGQIKLCFQNSYAIEFRDRWNQGWLWLSYQGHANFNVLGHENLIFNTGVTRLANYGKPFVFFGMGCHVSDFLRPLEGSQGPSIGEVALMLPTAGAIASYGSSGFEYLTPNATFMELLAETMFVRRVPDSPVLGPGLRNQWILGDVMARGEMETLALRTTLGIFRGDEMVAQYNLLGDPLTRMDAAAPRLAAAGNGKALVDGVSVSADPGVPHMVLDLSLIDETGIDRLEISDGKGRDYSAVVPELSGPDPRVESLQLDLPIYPQAYQLELATFDAARPELRRTVLGLNVELPLDFMVDGEAVAPGSTIEYQPGQPRSFRVEFTSPVDLAEDEIVVDAAGVTVASLTRTGGPRDWVATWEASPNPGETPGAMNLVLRGVPTELLSSGTAPEALPPAVVQHAVFPNPMPGQGRLVVRVQGAVERTRVSVYDLAGNEVGSREYLAVPDAESRMVLDFQGRDRLGDELANGTYFYRIQVEGPGGEARSDMGRVVIMR